MFVKKLSHNIYDVFLGKGYDNWTRVRRAHWGVSVVAGNRLSKPLLREVDADIRHRA